MDTYAKNRGFTLVELLVAMVILGVLAAIAYPSYLDYLHRSRRADALSTLTQYQMILERCYAQNFSYAAACASLPAFPQTSPQNFYTISLTGLTANGYTLTAVPQGVQATDTTCARISINQANVKTASDSGAGAQSKCWNP